MCGKEAQRKLARGDKIIVLVKGLAIFTTSKANNGLSISSQVISCP